MIENNFTYKRKLEIFSIYSLVSLNNIFILLAYNWLYSNNMKDYKHLKLPNKMKNVFFWISFTYIVIIAFSYIARFLAIKNCYDLLSYNTDENISLEYIGYFLPTLSLEYSYYSLFGIIISCILFFILQITSSKYKTFNWNTFFRTLLGLVLIISIALLILWFSNKGIEIIGK